MSLEVFEFAALIFVARVIDVAMGTMRTAFIVRGNRPAAFALGFLEMLVWVVVVAQVVNNLNHPAYAVAFALGFASGTTLGITIEEWFALGDQVVRVFTRQQQCLAAALRAEGYHVTEFEGTGRDGAVSLLFVQVQRRTALTVAARARALDPTCFYVIDDVRRSSVGVATTSTEAKDHVDLTN
jgi:uncharacterized protein YebE (UPF0316 family)